MVVRHARSVHNVQSGAGSELSPAESLHRASLPSTEKERGEPRRRPVGIQNTGSYQYSYSAPLLFNGRRAKRQDLKRELDIFFRSQE